MLARGAHLVCRRLAVLALAAVAALPALAELHVLARAHREADEVFDGAVGGEPLRVAARCAHGGSAHVEASNTVVLQRCAVCAVRSQARTLPALPRLAGRLLALGRALPPARHDAGLLFATPPSSRGPPRA